MENPNQYQGYITVSINDERYPKLFEDKSNNLFQLKENEYIAFMNDDNTVADCYVWQDGTHRVVNKKPIDSNQMIGRVKPKNLEQRFAIDLLSNDNITVKVITGGYGSGKTYLTAAYAMAAIKDGKYDKIVWVRNNIEVKNSNPIGFLKGDYYDKMLVWAMPLADHIGGVDELEMCIKRGSVEIQHLGFLRGRDIKNSIIFCSEAEHLTREHVQLLLGRVSEGSILVLEGDYKQIDDKPFEKDNGLGKVVERLAGNKLFGYVNLKESVRSETAKLADLLD